MTMKEAEKTGIKKALLSTIFFVAVLFVIVLVQTTKGDFGNGILFFMQYLGNGHLWVMMAILFGLTWLLGGLAGKAIIYKKWNFVLLANGVAVIIMLSIISYIALSGIMNTGNDGQSSRMQLTKTYFFELLQEAGLPLLGGLVVCWLWATYRMWLIAEAGEAISKE
jgi:hypothetical protein